jgi:CheY-like chemotaxis protein
VSVATDPGPRVVVADDQTLVRGGFRLILGAAGIPVVAEAADGREAVAAALKHRPDVVLMDIRMPEMDGLEATRRILAAARDGDGPRIIMLTTFDLDQYVYAASCSRTSPPSTWSPRSGWCGAATRCSRRPSPGGWWSGSRRVRRVRGAPAWRR